MESLKLNKDMQVEISARFIVKGKDLPLHGTDYTIRLYDRDFFEDEYLGECSPDENGKVIFTVEGGDFKHHPGENKMPDFFLVVLKNGKPIHQTPVMENVYLEGIETYKKGEGLVADIGSYLIEVEPSFT